MSTDDPGGGPEDWPVKHPWRLLPRGGTHPFVPPPLKRWRKNPVRGKGDGYLDASGNEWRPHHDPSGDPESLHWDGDVQHPNGKHTNIRPDGEVHHGEDNFSRGGR